jgi:hypothetical protein
MSQNRKVFVAKAVNYGASKASATQNTAVNPADLADGAIGVYGIHKAGATNLNRLVLIIDGGSEAAGVVPASTFVGDEIFVALGTLRGAQQSNPIQFKAGLKRVSGAAYSAPVRGVHNIGWNGTSGALNLPATINRGDEFGISVTDRNYPISGEGQPGQSVLLATQAVIQNPSVYQLLARFVADMNRRTDYILIDKATLKIRHNGTGAVFTTSATVAGVNGATTLTASAAHGITAGDFISLNNDLYQAIAGTTGTTIVLDRPYQGPTATIANANTLDITEAADFMNTVVTLQGINENATFAKTTQSTRGAGANALILDLERDALPKKGTEDLITSYIPKDTLRALNSGVNYDLYVHEIQNDNHPKGEIGSVFRVLNYLFVAFPSGVADTASYIWHKSFSFNFIIGFSG